MELLSLEEYKKRDYEFIHKHDEYLNRLVDINKRENQYMKEYVPEGDAEDRYFEKDRNGKYYDKRAQGFEDERESLKQEYGEFSSIYYADFGTILTEEALKVLNLSKTAHKIYEDGQKHLGDMFVETYGNVSKIYQFKHIVLCPDDLYWYGESVEANEPVYITCVGSPEWLVNNDEENTEVE